MRKSTRHSGPLECTDRISTYGCLLWDGRKPPPANPADLVVSLLVYSTARGLCAGSGHTTALPRPQPPPSPPTTTPTPSQPPVLVSQDAPPTHTRTNPPLLPHIDSFTAALLNQTAHWTCFTLHCLNNINEDMIRFTVNCLKMYAVDKRLVHPQWGKNVPVMVGYQAMQI